ncbi:hypothetical protein GCM10009818_09950 [Nakamurella flavida]
MVSALVLAVAGAPSAAAAGPAVGSFDTAAVSGTQAIVSGWALDPNAPAASTQAHVYVNGVGYAVAADVPRPDVNAARGVTGRHGFAASVPLQAGSNEICVYAISLTGGGNTSLGCRTTSGPEPVGVVDDGTFGVTDAGVGTLSLTGWTVDPIAPAASNQIHAYVNGVGYPFTADIPRPDVNQALGVPGDHGFDFTVPLNPGANEVCLFLIPVSGGSNTDLGCENFDLAAAAGSLDDVRVTADGTAVLAGWAVDPNFPEESSDVHIYNGATGAAFLADGPRADVNAALGIPGDHGFSVEVPLTAGVNTLCAYAISFTGGSNSLLGCREVKPLAAVGSLDSVQASADGTSVRLAGWAVDPNAPDVSTEVHIYNGATGAAFAADQPRDDVNAALGITGAHGFIAEVPLTDGVNTLCAYAISLTGGDNTPLGCQDVTGGPASTIVSIGLITINDFHGRIDANTVKFAGTIEGLRETLGADNTLLLSAGDNIGASLFASAIAQDQPTIDVMNALGFDASAVGNHEFDQGFADLTGRVIGGDGGNAPVDFPYLGANVYLKGTTTPALPEYTVIVKQGVRVGVIGAVTQETSTLVSPAGIAELEFGDPVDAVNRVAAQLTDGDEANGEADVIVAEYHEGANAVGTTTTLDEAVAANPVFAEIVTQTSPAVDVIFNGHTHQVYAFDAPVPGVDGAFRPVLQTGSYGANVGGVNLAYDTATGETKGYAAANIPQITDQVTEEELVATFPRVAAVKTIVDAALANAATVGDQQVGSVADDITTAFSGGSYGPDGVYTGGTRDDRSKESALGDLVADSLLSTLSSPERGGAQIGVVNPGGLRNELLFGADGVITYAEANSVLPFVNNLYTTTLTGAKVKELLEQQWQTNPGGAAPSRPYLQLGLSDNVTYTFDSTRPQGDRITSITVDGAPIDPAAPYRIGTFSFLAAGGDNFRAFLDGTDTADSGLIDRDAWIQYLGDNQDLAPDFARQAVEVVGAPTTVATGETVTFTVSGLDLTSLGAPANQLVGVLLGDRPLGDVTVANGSAQISFAVPDDAPTGEQTLSVVAAPSGTVVSLPMTITAG